MGHKAVLVHFYSAILAKVPLKSGLDTKHGFPVRLPNDFTYNLVIHIALVSAMLQPRPLRSRNSLAQPNSLVRKEAGRSVRYGKCSALRDSDMTLLSFPPTALSTSRSARLLGTVQKSVSSISPRAPSVLSFPPSCPPIHVWLGRTRYKSSVNEMQRFLEAAGASGCLACQSGSNSEFSFVSSVSAPY